MSFSVDFQSGDYEPASGARCVLVIERSDRKRAEQFAQISPHGTWSVFVNEWASESGPFQAWVEEISESGGRREVSAHVRLE